MKLIAFSLLLVISTLLGQAQINCRMTVFYFGGTDCPHSTDPKTVANINTIRTQLAKKHSEYAFKFVMVVMDDSIEQGYQFARSYVPWDEVSIGSFYQNELMLQHINPLAIPGVPHIMVYSDSLVTAEKHNVPLLRKRTLLVDLVGSSQIDKWIQSDFPIQR